MASTSDDENDNYRMDHKRRGLAVVINNESFDPETHLNDRKGSDVDSRRIKKQLVKLGFEVKGYRNVRTRKMVSIMIEVGNLDHSDADCVAFVILSHGIRGAVYGRDDSITIEELLEPFKGNRCSSLVGKPKLFFIQACQGDRKDDGIASTLVADGEDETDASPGCLHRIPTESDFLIAYSVVPGFYSWRNKDQGSWFIQALVEVLKRFGRTHDLLSILTKVNRKVAYDFESRTVDPDMTGKKQIPCVVSMLTKRVLFPPK